jgi:peptidoglycan/xylan/chitin deacetylase (PgdA/CDA1 family)
VILTFDDGYVDFAEYAWPLLQKYGFSTTLFVVTERVGGWNQWDTAIGEDVPLLGWNDLRALQAEGVDIGSHSATHRSMVGLRPEDVVREAATSRLVLLKKLGRDVSTFAYPFGLSTRPVEHLTGAAGYVFGLTCANRPASPHDSLLALPRLPIPGSENLLRFLQRLAT